MKRRLLPAGPEPGPALTSAVRPCLGGGVSTPVVARPTPRRPGELKDRRPYNVVLTALPARAPPIPRERFTASREALTVGAGPACRPGGGPAPPTASPTAT